MLPAVMDPIEAAHKPGGEKPFDASPAEPVSALPVTQTPSVPILLMVLALVTVAGGGALVRHFGGTIYPIAYAAAVLAALSLPLLLLGGWRRQLLEASRLLLGRSMEQWSLFAIFVFFLAFYGITRFGPTPFYEPSVQAAAFLHGHAWVDAPGYMEQVGPICNTNLPIAKKLPDCDLTRFHGRTFLVHPPLAAIVMMPFVAAHGAVADGADQYQPSVSVLLGAIEVALAWRLLLLLGMAVSTRIWLTAFFGIGTTLWYEAALGASWDFVSLVSVLPTLLALNEVFGKARPWLVGVFAALAALGRNDMAIAAPIYGLLLLTVRGRRLSSVFGMLPGFAMAGVVYGVFNYSRYGTFFDQALWLWYRCCDGNGYFNPSFHQAIPGPLSLHFLPVNLHTVLFLGWGLSDVAPWLHPLGGGQALILTSPAFILALRPSLKRWGSQLMWLATVLCMGPAMLWYANGFVQFGPRYWIQVYPFLLVLVALGIGRAQRADQLTKILVLASILLVSFGMWHLHMFSFD
jgi:hypothetical protein